MKGLRARVSMGGHGFALPTILISSVVMMMVLLAGVQVAVSIRVALDNQYYNTLARDAAESGAVKAKACIEANPESQDGWSGTLTPNKSCNGTISGSNYLLDTPQLKTSFNVTVAERNSNNLPVSLAIEGVVTRHRESNEATVWRSYTASLNAYFERDNVAVSDLASGVLATCAAIGGKAYCWGSQADGRLGNNVNNGSVQRNPTPVYEETGLLAGREVTQVSVGHGSACALAVLPGNSAGRVYCWGDNTQGQLGINSTVASSSRPVAVRTTTSTTVSYYLPEGETITKITTGRGYACAVTTDERLYCWGNNSSGQLGLGNTTMYRYPYLVSSLSSVKDVSAGSGTKTTCAIATLSGINRLYCWGNNRQGQVGVGGTNAPQGVPLPSPNHIVTTPQRVVNHFTSAIPLNVSVGGYSGGDDVNSSDLLERGYVCAVSTTKHGYCWGSAIRASLGYSDQTDGSDVALVRSQAIFNSSFSGHENYVNGNIEKIVTGWGTTCALRTTMQGVGDLYHNPSPTKKALLCWGSNELSNLGMNDATATKSNFTNLWSGVNAPPSTNSCPVYVHPDKLRCMLALRVPRHMPAFQSNSPLHTAGISDLFGGGHRMCVVSGGRLYCWGSNSTGQVGSSATTAPIVAWPTLANLIENLRKVYTY